MASNLVAIVNRTDFTIQVSLQVMFPHSMRPVPNSSPLKPVTVAKREIILAQATRSKDATRGSLVLMTC